MAILTYPQVLDEIEKSGPRTDTNLLVGNGFSRAFADAIFDYRSLYQKAREKGLTREAIAVFEKLGETNFERVLKAYDECLWIAENYNQKLDETIPADRDAIRKILVGVISENHPENQDFMDDATTKNAHAFMEGFTNLFTTNYDLILYWLIMSGDEKWDDGFRRVEGDLCFTGFQGPSRIYFLHGALHIVRQGKSLIKLSWNGKKGKLKQLIKASIEKGQYPIFVAEGDSSKKKYQIDSNRYLRKCLQALQNTEGVLVIFGLSLDPAFDKHIIDAIHAAKGLTRIYFGVYGDDHEMNNAEFLKYARSIGLFPKLTFFQSKSVTL
ncbi:DUF4917 family protein [Dawidia soli]|uniref:DUF4917 family protein n=1 Tax=Dawidia soli TaxID=2782352 RepID=A0AAP2GJA8_9BACT|nr:DUF4917 family protein [Dawidia soli]MBT1689211.1 DUF4917 family protein [Dawidia soli]